MSTNNSSDPQQAADPVAWTKTALQRRYSELCTQLGDALMKQERATAIANTIRREIDVLDRLAGTTPPPPPPPSDG